MSNLSKHGMCGCFLSANPSNRRYEEERTRRMTTNCAWGRSAFIRGAATELNKYSGLASKSATLE